MKRKLRDRDQVEDSDDILQTYFAQIKSFPLLAFEDELVLSKRIKKGDTEALHLLVNSNLRLVIKIARGYVASDVALLDLIQEGNLGLMHAAERYDNEKNVRFCTYAGWWIRQFIGRYLTNKRRLVRLPHRKEEILRNIQRTYHSLSQTLMHQPRSEEIAHELGISVQDVDSIISMGLGPLSLEIDSMRDENAATLEYHEDYTYSPERTLLRKFSRDGARRFLDKLKDRERRVLECRYQLTDGVRYTLKEIGDEMDLSPETVRQIEMKALQKIRRHANELRNYVSLEEVM